MSATTRPLCVIPARGGSKRFPRKNIALLGGKPLLAWTIKAANDSGIFDAVWVSSDDGEILEVAKEFGASLLPRSVVLADDRATVAEVCVAVGDEFASRNQPHDVVVALLPTSPLRSGATIRNAYEFFVKRNGEAMVSCSPLAHPPQWAMTVEDGLLCAAYPEAYNTPRNELPPMVGGDGLIMMAKHAYLRAHNSFMGDKTLAYLSPPGETADIDEPEDLRWAEFLISQEGNGS